MTEPTIPTTALLQRYCEAVVACQCENTQPVLDMTSEPMVITGVPEPALWPMVAIALLVAFVGLTFVGVKHE